LVVTLALMILLTVIAVGLLSLSSISLRSSSQGDAMQAARANARMALMLAIGDIQKQLGPDTRISAAADQMGDSNGSTPTAPQTQRQWAGVYDSWPTALPNAARPTPQFRQWLVSGDPTQVMAMDYAGTQATGDTVEIVTANSVGDGDTVRVPLISQTGSEKNHGRVAWWVSDLGMKGLIGQSKELPTTIGDTRADQQSAPGTNLQGTLVKGTIKPFENLAATDPLLANVVSQKSSALLADKPENVRPLFHDFTAQSRGLLTNVRKGGFRQDLSMSLERPISVAPAPASTALYRVGGESGINMNELWAYYNLPSTYASSKGVRKSGSASFTTGGAMSSGTPYLQLETTPSACKNDDWFYYKQPVIISYQLVLSFKSAAVGTTGNFLHIVADPIITLWNPLDVPVVLPANLPLTVKYWSVPYDITIAKNGVIMDCPVASVSANDSNFMSLEMGVLHPLVFKPGEVIKMSQKGAILASNMAGQSQHRLAGSKGFNFGNGFAIQAKTRAGASIPVAANDRITFVSAKPNNLTAGKTSAHGNVIGTNNHTRHFSLTHHEYYVGTDRASLGDSLGIGGIFLDYDFGNRRLRASDPLRTETGPGTKPASERYYAINKPDVFKTFPNDGRVIPTTPPASSPKMPFMLFSFCAKTEASSTLGTRSLARFNPKAHHVDFYNLSQSERDMLPYEYSVEILNGWKSQNGSLEEDSIGRGYFGGGLSAADGSTTVATHSVPREPIVSLAAFQHSFANGFEIQKPKSTYSTINAREPMLPQISHAIGNSLACPVLPKDKVEGTLPGGRPLADHSYLANQALWDDYFLSGIAPQMGSTFGKARNQKTVADQFFKGEHPLPVPGYKANLRGMEPAKLVSTYFSGAVPSNLATTNIASFISVEGMFNVNSTSVEAWKSLLAGRKARPVLVRDANGRESVQPGDDNTPVAGLLGPINQVSEGDADVSDKDQWVGRRTLTDEEIDLLARGIVKEVRKRGPFLSLADFINRRVGSDAELARAGAIQNALDDADTKINEGFISGRSTTAASRFAFPDAEEGPISHGIPGIVKQADILTPIAPLLSVRSDTFMVRGYGEKTDASGKVLARAWCEAVVQRSAEFVDTADVPEKAYASINEVNQTFGRRFDIISFRWLNASEA
jgi:hypothetical protein